MTKKKTIMSLLFAVLVLTVGFGALTASARDVKPRKVNITRSSKTLYVGGTYEIKTRTSPSDSDDDYLYWSIVSGKNVVRFTDRDRYDDDIKIKALKPGTAKIRCRIRGTKKYDTITIKVIRKKYTYAFYRVGKTTRTVEVGDDFELKVKKTSGLKDNDLKWSIKNKNILRFDDRDITDDEVELKARRTGTTYVTCYNKKTKKKINYKIKVIRERDDDDDDDDDRYDRDDRDDDDDDDDD